MNSTRPPLRAARRSSRLVRMVLVLAALLGLALATATPASAYGYSVSYSVRNDTNQTLTFVSAHGPGNNCNIRQFRDGKCFGTDESAKVSPAVVQPGQAIGLQSTIDPFSFQPNYYIRVTYQIGSERNDQVVLTVEPQSVEASCKVQGTRAWKCYVIPVGRLRDFHLTAA